MSFTAHFSPSQTNYGKKRAAPRRAAPRRAVSRKAAAPRKTVHSHYRAYTPEEKAHYYQMKANHFRHVAGM